MRGNESLKDTPNVADTCIAVLALVRSGSTPREGLYRDAIVKGVRIRNSGRMRYSAQIRAARALLGWSQTQLARRAGLGLATLQRIERNEGIQKGKFSTVIKIQKALEQAGIHFIEDDTGEAGVRLKMKAR